MLKTATLHQLIQSLTPSEKRRFKLEASLYEGEKNYLLLFEALDELEEYEETQLLQNEKVQAFASDLRMVQNYLYKKLLRSLRHQQEEEMIDLKINNLMAEAKILEQRGLFELSGETLQKAYKLTKKYQKYTHSIDLLKKIAQHKTNHVKKNLTAQVNSLFEEATNISDLVQSEIFLLWKNHWVYSKVLKRRLENNDNEMSIIKKELDSSQFQRFPNSESLTINYLFYNLWGYYSYLKQKVDESEKHFENVLNIWDNHPHMVEENLRQYIINISNLINLYIYTKKYYKANKLLEKLLIIETKTFYEKALVFQAYNYYKLFHLLNVKDYLAASNFVSTFEEELDNYKKNHEASSPLRFLL